MDILLIFPNSFRRGAPPRHEGRAPPRGRDGFPGPKDFGPEENFDASDETARGRDLRGRGRGTPRGELRTMGLGRTGMKSWVVVSTPGIVCDCGGVLFHCVGGRKGLLPTPDEFPRFEGGRKPDSWDGNREPGRAVELLVP